MIKNFFSAAVLTMLSTSIALAQCSCGGCSFSGSCEPTGHDASGRWLKEIFCCNRPNLLDVISCAPWCRQPYFSMYGGVANLDNFRRQIVTVPGVIDATAEVKEEQGALMSDGSGIGGALGYRVHPRLRLEGEITYRSNHASNWFTHEFTEGVLTSNTRVSADGQIDNYAGIFNLIFDVSPRRVGCFNLYSGAGLGLLYATGDITTATDVYTVSNESFAYQIIGGLNYPIRHRVEWFTEYKYLGADRIRVDDPSSAISLGDFEFDSHNVFMGFRFTR